MKHLLLCLISAFLVNSSDFLSFNTKLLGLTKNNQCHSPNYFIEEANHEELDPINQDKIIVYHGESYGIWIFQLLLKAFLFPNAPEDWLPLRMADDSNDVCKIDLLLLINDEHDDEERRYTAIGLSASPNLVSRFAFESAWTPVCQMPSFYWHQLNGLSGCLKSLFNSLEQLFIPEEKRERFTKQKDLIMQFIQIKRKLPKYFHNSNLVQEFEEYFPQTFANHYSYLSTLNEEYKHSLIDETKENQEGVLLQIIMERFLANELMYDAHPYGWLKSERIPFHYSGKTWKGERLDLYSDVYDEVKNKKDGHQVRIALNRDFKSYPSRVRIKSIAGIMQSSKDYSIIKSMINEMTNT